MSLHPWPQYQTRSGRAPQSSSRTSEVDRVICLSRQKLQLESARDEPDLRKLLAHVCTVEHVQGWLRENPPRRMAPSPADDFKLNDQEGEMPQFLRKSKTAASISQYWPTGGLRRTVTVVREVECDDDTSDEDSDSSEESWNGSDTSEQTTFDFPAKVSGYNQSHCSPAVTVCRDFAYNAEKVAEPWKQMPKLLSVAQCRELAIMISA